jgi:hypothetical protein
MHKIYHCILIHHKENLLYLLEFNRKLVGVGYLHISNTLVETLFGFIDYEVHSNN